MMKIHLTTNKAQAISLKKVPAKKPNSITSQRTQNHSIDWLTAFGNNNKAAVELQKKQMLDKLCEPQVIEILDKEYDITKNGSKLTGLDILKEILPQNNGYSDDLRYPDERLYNKQGKTSYCELTGRELIKKLCKKDRQKNELATALNSLRELGLINVKILNLHHALGNNESFYMFKSEHPNKMPLKGVCEEITITDLGIYATLEL